MNTRWLVIFLTAMFLFPEFACSANGRLCQPGVYVFFGNGVWNDKEDADSSIDILAGQLKSYVSGTDLEDLITYATAHNPSNGILLDLLETYEQNRQTDWSRFWRCLASLDPMPDFLQNKLIEIANTVDEKIVKRNPAVQVHIEKYNKLLSEGNKVVVVAHSQGNLFANIAYPGIDPDCIDGFGIVSVGNPDNYVAGSGPHTTLEEDIIIGFVPKSIPANVDNFFGINLYDVSGHQFGRSYMAVGHRAETKILDDTVGQINSLNFPDNRLGDGIITATLTWGSNRDLDLHVFEPDGSHVYYKNRHGSSGYLDRDDRNGYGPEHYYVSCDSIAPGMYRFGVNYYRGSSAETGTLSVKVGDQIRTRQQIFTKWFYSSGDSNPYIMFEVEVSGSEEEGYDFVIQ